MSSEIIALRKKDLDKLKEKLITEKKKSVGALQNKFISTIRAILIFQI
jgi:hypothetical protein